MLEQNGGVWGDLWMLEQDDGVWCEPVDVGTE